MADAIKVNSTSNLTCEVVKESSNAPAAADAGRTDRFDQYNSDTGTLNATSTPKATQLPIDLSDTLVGASVSVDLTAAPLAEDLSRSVDLTGKKLLALLVVMGASNNAAGVTLKPNASNGYDLFGASGQVVLGPGARLNLAVSGASLITDDVGASDKVIDFAGTAGDSWQCLAVFGEN